MQSETRVQIRAYSSHIPVLMAIAQECRIQRVVEFGSGVYSTLTFLNRSIFPHLTFLRSYENVAVWYDRMKDKITDHRHHYVFTHGPVSERAASDDLLGFDLLFLDDSKTAAERIKTIEQVVRKNLDVPLIIHDYQYRGYHRAASPHYEHAIIYDTVASAHCGLLWNGHVISADSADRIRHYLDNLAVEILT